MNEKNPGKWTYCCTSTYILRNVCKPLLEMVNRYLKTYDGTHPVGLLYF